MNWATFDIGTWMLIVLAILVGHIATIPCRKRKVRR